MAKPSLNSRQAEGMSFCYYCVRVKEEDSVISYPENYTLPEEGEDCSTLNGIKVGEDREAKQGKEGGRS